MSGKWEDPAVPHSGWECIDIQDLGAPAMTCQMCDHEIVRYVHYMQHHDYINVLAVGYICAGKMEGDSQNATLRDAFMKSRMNKKKKWLERKWKVSRHGNQYIKSDGFVVVMKQIKGLWVAFVKSENGDSLQWSTRGGPNENEIKLAAFDYLTKTLAEKIIPTKTAAAPVHVKIEAILETKKDEAIKPEAIIPAPENNSMHIENTVTDAVLNFTNEQIYIFSFIKNGQGHGIIDAVAGSGKTTTIMECAKYVDDKTDLLFCAFNKSIQSEIAAKFNRQGLNQVTVKTIHALGFQILKDSNNTGRKLDLQETKYWNILNRDQNIQKLFAVYMEELLALNGYRLDEADGNRQFAVKDLVHKFKDRLLDINHKLRATLTPDNIDKFKSLIEHFSYFTDIETKSASYNKEVEIYFKCSKILLDAGNALARDSLVIDFTDMLYLPFIWDLRASRTYSFLFIDECQDLSKSQLAVVLKYGKKGGRILAVGDPFQSIYGFAGADIESFKRIQTTIKAKELPLTTCFRCPPNIVTLAAGIRKDITACKLDAGVIEEIAFKDVVNKAMANDLVLSRYREALLFLVFEFINKNRQVQIHRDEVNDIIDELKNLFKQEERHAAIWDVPGGFESIKRAVSYRWRYIIEREAGKLANAGERQIYIQSKTDYLNNRLEFLHKKHLEWSCQTIDAMFDKVREYISASDNCIKLSTIHRAKGLESERVFILNYDDLPYVKNNQKPWERTQELNLKYVAITRALSELYLVKPEKINDMKNDPSLFDEFAVRSKW